MDLDPEPIPNIVLHPGDTLVIGDHADAGGVAFYRLLDRHGNCFAVLDCERNDHGWGIHAIRFVSTIGGREAVRAQPEPDPHGLTVYDAVPDTASPTATVSANYDTDGKPYPPPTRNVILSNFGRVTVIDPADLTDPVPVDDRHYPRPDAGDPGADPAGDE